MRKSDRKFRGMRQDQTETVMDRGYPSLGGPISRKTVSAAGRDMEQIEDQMVEKRIGWEPDWVRYHDQLDHRGYISQARHRLRKDGESLVQLCEPSGMETTRRTSAPLCRALR